MQSKRKCIVLVFIYALTANLIGSAQDMTESTEVTMRKKETLRPEVLSVPGIYENKLDSIVLQVNNKVEKDSPPSVAEVPANVKDAVALLELSIHMLRPIMYCIEYRGLYIMSDQFSFNHNPQENLADGRGRADLSAFDTGFAIKKGETRIHSFTLK